MKHNGHGPVFKARHLASSSPYPASSYAASLGNLADSLTLDGDQSMELALAVQQESSMPEDNANAARHV